MEQFVETYKYKNVLLIDDNELDLFVSSTLLRLYKFSNAIQINNSALTSLEYLMKQMQLFEQGHVDFPDVIFVDLDMPTMDGFQFLEYFYEIFAGKIFRPKMVVLSTTISPRDNVRISAISKDIIVLEKPLTKETIERI